MKKELLETVSKIASSDNKGLLTENQEDSVERFKSSLKALPDNEYIVRGDEYDSVMDQATRLKIEFEDSHPKLANTMSEIIRILSDMGI